MQTRKVKLMEAELPKLTLDTLSQDCGSVLNPREGLMFHKLGCFTGDGGGVASSTVTSLVFEFWQLGAL